MVSTRQAVKPRKSHRTPMKRDSPISMAAVDNDVGLPAFQILINKKSKLKDSDFQFQFYFENSTLA